MFRNVLRPTRFGTISKRIVRARLGFGRQSVSKQIHTSTYFCLDRFLQHSAPWSIERTATTPNINTRTSFSHHPGPRKPGIVREGPWICGCPVRGLAYASRPVWRRGKGPKPPGFLPALSGSRRTDRRLDRPPPSGHAGPASTSDALGGDSAPPEMRVEGCGVESGVCVCCARLVEGFRTGTWRDLPRTLPTCTGRGPPKPGPPPEGGT